LKKRIPHDWKVWAPARRPQLKIRSHSRRSRPRKDWPSGTVSAGARANAQAREDRRARIGGRIINKLYAVAG
jgi:hypothetical protein